MSLHVFYYQSPVGLIRLEANKQALVRACFVETVVVSEPSNNAAFFALVCMQLNEYFKGARIQFDVPFELIGTEFQKTVWRYAATLSYGATCSYGELAECIGCPTAYRAVAQALGKNPLLFVVPCHRVIGANGTLCGYAGGIERKKWLLNHERAFALFSQPNNALI